MGNQLSAPSRPAHDLVAEVPGLVFKESLGGGRLMKSCLCVHDDAGLVVVKIYQKRNPDSSSGSPSLRPVERQLMDISERLARGGRQATAAEASSSLPSSSSLPPPSPPSASSTSPSPSSSFYPHFLPVARALETPRAAYLLRPYAHTSLRARCGTRPFLSDAEKDWIAFQLLAAVAGAHALAGGGVVHGDLKAENVLLTSSGWLLLADFAPYKPGALPADNPADFTAFFDDAAGSRRCCLAPERFVDGESRGSGGGKDGADAAAAHAAAAAVPFRSRHAPLALTEAMDVFSAGCVLAELYADGRPLFDLSRLLAYRKSGSGGGGAAASSGGGGGGGGAPDAGSGGGRDSVPSLAAVPPALRPLVRSMVAVDPKARPTAAEALRRAEASAHFPRAFFDGGGKESDDPARSPSPPPSLHDLFRDQHSLDADGRIAAVLAAAPRFLREGGSGGGGGEGKKKKRKGRKERGGKEAAAAAAAAAAATEPQGAVPASASAAAAPSIVSDVSKLLSATEGLLARLTTNDRDGAEGAGGAEQTDDEEEADVVVERVDEVEFRAPAQPMSSSPLALAPPSSSSTSSLAAAPIGSAVSSAAAAPASSPSAAARPWVPADPAAAGLTPALDGVASGSRRTREQVRLPFSDSTRGDGRGWVWASEWALDTAAAPAADAQGWSYSGGGSGGGGIGGGSKTLDGDDDDDEGGVFAAAAASSAEWTAEPSPDACWRRRQWVRVRRRVIAGAGAVAPAAPAAAAAASAGIGGDESSDESGSESDDDETTETARRSSSSSTSNNNPHHDAVVATVLTGLLDSLLRGAPSPDARASGASCLARVAAAADDAARLDRALPYLVALLTSDDAPRVRAAAVRALVVLMRSVGSLSGAAGGALASSSPAAGAGAGGAAPSSSPKSSSSAAAGTLSAYLWPSLGQAAASDGDEGVRVALAGALAPLACAAARLLRSEGRGGGGGGDDDGDDDGKGKGAGVVGGGDGQEGKTAPSDSDSDDEDEADSESLELVRFVERALHDLSVGASSSSATRLALLPGLGSLAAVLGRAEANDVVLPAAITFLNDRDARVRAAFFRHGRGLAAAAGPAGLEAFLLPCLDQALADESPAVAAAALSFLADACEVVDGGDGDEKWKRATSSSSSPSSSSSSPNTRAPGPALPLLRRRPMLAAARRVLPSALAAGSPAVVRLAGARFAAAAARALASPAEAFALVSPLLRGACEREPADLTDAASIAAVLLRRNDKKEEEEEGGEEESAAAPAAAGVAVVPPPPPLLELATNAPLQVLPAPAASSSSGALQPGASALECALAAAGMPLREDDDGAAAAEEEQGGQGEERECSTSNIKNSNALFRRPATKELISRAARRVLPGGGAPSSSARNTATSTAADLALLGAEADGEAYSFYGVPTAAVAAANAESAIAVAAAGSLLPAGASPSSSSSAHASTSSPSRPLLAPPPSSSWGPPPPSPSLLDRASPPWRPRGSLVAHLAEHSRAVNALAVPASGARFFATASSDGVARVWGSVGLERDASARSRAAYAGQAAAGAARLLCASSCAAAGGSAGCSSDAVATGCSAGTVHVWRVGYAPAGGRAGAPERVAGIFVGSGAGAAGTGGSGAASAAVRAGGRSSVGSGTNSGGALSSISSAAVAASASAATVASPGEGAVFSLFDWHPTSTAPAAGQGLLLYSTARGGVHGWDLRQRGRGGSSRGGGGSGSKTSSSSSSSQDAWVLTPPACEGSVRAIVADPVGSSWILTGSSRGVLSLWDARLLIRVSAWRLPGAPSVDALAVAAAPWERLVGGGAANNNASSSSSSSSSSSLSPPSGPLVWCAAGGEASLWEISRGAPRLVLRSRPSGSSAAAAAAGSVPATLRGFSLSTSSSSTSPPPPLPTDLSSTSIASRSRGAVRSLLSTGAGPLITGGGDGVLRLWDCSRPDDSYVVAGFPPDDDGDDDETFSSSPSSASESNNPLPRPPPPPQRLRPRGPRVYSRRVVEGGVVVVEEAKAATTAAARGGGGAAGASSAAASSAADDHGSSSLADPFSVESAAASLAHRDSITALASVVGQGGVRLLLSASRDGVVKAWR